MKVMLIGKTGSGKTTLIQRLEGKSIEYSKTQMISYCDKYIDTPGEYLENKMMLRNLLVTSNDVDTIILVQDGEETQSMFPPNISTMFMGKKIIGVVTKNDKIKNCNLCEEWLRLAGAQKIFFIGFNDEKSLEDLKEELNK